MKKAALTIFSCYFQIAGNSSKNSLIFSFHPFTTLLWNFKTIPSTILQLFNLNQGHSSKELFLWLSLSLCVSVSLSLCISLELPNFGHMDRSKICFKWRDNFFWLYDVITYFCGEVANFADIINITIALIKKTPLKTQ